MKRHGAPQVRVGRGEKLGTFRRGLLGGGGGIAEEALAVGLLERREGADDRARAEEDRASPDGVAGAAGPRRFRSGIDAPECETRQERGGSGCDRDPQRKVAEGQERDAEKRREKRVGRGVGRRSPLPAGGEETRKERRGRPAPRARGGHAGLGGERDGVTV